jgi:hypothetical protein
VGAGVGGAVACFAVHSAFDYLWHVPVLPVTLALLVGLSLGAVADPIPTERARRGTARLLMAFWGTPGRQSRGQ